MEAAESFTALRARYVFPVIGTPIRDGIVTLHGDRIVAVGKASDVAATDLGNVAIVPGLVNAHTHLEFSDLQAPLGKPGESLPDWIRKVIAYRRTQAGKSDVAIRRGLDESLAAGITAIGDIVTSLPGQVSSQPSRVRFHEVICLDAQRIDEVLEAVQAKIESLRGPGEIDGISPHAPYTVNPSLFGPLVELANRLHAPVAVHLAESPEELELLRTGAGPFRGLLEELGVWRDDANPQGLRSLDYLRLMCDAPRALVVHGNYLDEAEIEFVGRHRDKLRIAYCPRTHAYFGHVHYPLELMLRHGATVCVGTDSRASNPDLNLFDELKFIAEHHVVSPSVILQMGTLNGAKMLFGDERSGAIEPHRRADLAIIELPDRESADPHELLFCDESHVTQTWCGGRII